MEFGSYRRPGLSGHPAARKGYATEKAPVDVKRRAFAVLAIAGLAIHAGFAASGRSSRLIDDWLYCGLFLLAAAACARRAQRGDARTAWSAAAAGVLVWGCAEIVFRLLEPDPHAWYPQAAQALLFVAFSLAYVTLGLLARERVRQFDPVLALDGVLAGLAAAAVAAVLLFPRATPARRTFQLHRLGCSYSEP